MDLRILLKPSHIRLASSGSVVVSSTTTAAVQNVLHLHTNVHERDRAHGAFRVWIVVDRCTLGVQNTRMLLKSPVSIKES